MRYEVFVFFCLTFHLALKVIHVVISKVSLFLRLNHLCIHVYLPSSFSHVSIGTWVASVSWLLWLMLQWTWGCINLSSVLFLWRKCQWNYWIISWFCFWWNSTGFRSGCCRKTSFILGPHQTQPKCYLAKGPEQHTQMWAWFLQPQQSWVAFQGL